MAYVTDADFRAYVGSTVPADSDTIAASLAAAERLVNQWCHRSFNNTDGQSASRSYVPTGGPLVLIDDLIDSTGIAITENGVTVASTDYQLEPLNNLNDSGETVPYHQIRRLSGVWYTDGGKATITVTSARWGWGATPPKPVVEATKILAKDLVHMRSNRFGVADFGDIGVIRMRENPMIQILLRHYRHPRSAEVA